MRYGACNPILCSSSNHQQPPDKMRTRASRRNYGTHGFPNFRPVSSTYSNVPLNPARCHHTSIPRLQLRTAAPSSAFEQAGDSDGRLSRWISVIQSEPPPPPSSTHTHAHTHTHTNTRKAVPHSHPSPIVSEACHDPRAFGFSSPDLFIFITTMTICMLPNAHA